jgi:hypothetical protein
LLDLDKMLGETSSPTSILGRLFKEMPAIEVDDMDSMTKSPNNSAGPNRRPGIPFDPGRQSGRASFAPRSLSEATAHPRLSAEKTRSKQIDT